jgi:hypothetical protein
VKGMIGVAGSRGGVGRESDGRLSGGKKKIKLGGKKLY